MHAVARRLQKIADRGAEGRVAPVADVQRAGRIGRHKLQEDLRAVAAWLTTVLLAALEHGGDLVVIGRVANEEVDEPRSGNVDLRYYRILGKCVDDASGKLAGVGANRFREPHCYVGGEVAMARVARPLDGCRNGVPFRKVIQFGHPRQRIVDEFGNSGFHSGGAPGTSGGRQF